MVRTISARALWIRILTARIETGEPYLIFSDHVNRARPEHHKLAGLEVKTSNLCSEITLPTGRDQHGMERTAVCCLSSLNLENWFEWKDHPTFIEDVMRFLDNVLQDFIDRAPPGMEKARYAAMRERSRRAGRDGVPLVPAVAERAVGERRSRRCGTRGCSSTSASRRTWRRACWRRSAGRARTPPNTA